MAPLLVPRLQAGPLNWLIAENADRPAQAIATALAAATPDIELDRLGLIETQILRTGMLATDEVRAKEPLALLMQDWWTLCTQ